MWQPDGRGVWERMDTCVGMAQSLCCPLKIIPTLVISSTPIQNEKFLKIFSKQEENL